ANYAPRRTRAAHPPHAGGAPPAAPDPLAEIVRVHPPLEAPAPAQVVAVYLDIVGMIHDALHQVLKSLLEHLTPRCPACPQLAPCPRRGQRHPWRPRCPRRGPFCRQRNQPRPRRKLCCPRRKPRHPQRRPRRPPGAPPPPRGRHRARPPFRALPRPPRLRPPSPPRDPPCR